VIKVVVPISGGKDSQACLILALREHPACEVRGLFCDTKFEHPWTYTHVRWMAQHYGVQIDWINAGSVLGKSIKYGRFPGGGARHCTDELKMVPSRKYYKALAESQGGFQVWYGMRSDESPEREKRYRGILDTDLHAPHEVLRRYPKYLGKMGVMFRLPVIDFATSEIFELLDGKRNPLYDAGFDRVGCFPCLAGGDKWKEQAFAFDEFGKRQYKITWVIAQHINKPIFTSKGGQERNGCAVCAI
jgi:3'-phosphoadenosine 5'-phosphosulfate sulfotransferase (PAPS reductase)/FAD synthetase